MTARISLIPGKTRGHRRAYNSADVSFCNIDLKFPFLFPEVLLPRPNMVTPILCADFDTMPLAVFEIVRGVVADAVLIAQLGCDLVKHALNFASTIFGPVP